MLCLMKVYLLNIRILAKQTGFSDEVFEDGFLRMQFRIVEPRLVFRHEFLHLGAVVEFQQGSRTPHDGEYGESLEMHWGDLTGRDESLQQIATLSNTSSLLSHLRTHKFKYIRIFSHFSGLNVIQYV